SRAPKGFPPVRGISSHLNRRSIQPQGDPRNVGDLGDLGDLPPFWQARRMNRPTPPLAYHWGAATLPPRVALRLFGRRPISLRDPPGWHCTGPATRPFDFTAAMHSLCEDIVRRSPPLAHIDLGRVLFTIIRARNGRRHGLQARVTPLRFRSGALATV